MAKKMITDELLKKVLEVFYPGGYGRTNDRPDADAWYIGWFGIDGRTECGLPLEINREGSSTIVFLWWTKPCCEDFTRDQLVGYIRGVLSQLLPGIQMNHDTDDWSISFSYPDND